MSAVVNSLTTYTSSNIEKNPLLDFIVPLAEVLMASGKLSAQHQCHSRNWTPIQNITKPIQSWLICLQIFKINLSAPLIARVFYVFKNLY
ncbi:hypothetical protein TNCT_298771 [Trichonephila clavata]|uniref:Uncharacterized protein n=1 Tax=Trichonephila clavata TaxID=2740835 RepID=A0A8X6JP94_TRICU|nr:hypothetical protein TNCT_298771 [Trichonephila clavata]